MLPFCEFTFFLHNTWCRRHFTYDCNLWLHFWMVSINLLYGLLSFFRSGLLLRSQTEWPRMKCQHRIAAVFDLHGEEELSNWWKLDWSDNQRWQQPEESTYPEACRSNDDEASPHLESAEGYNEQKYKQIPSGRKAHNHSNLEWISSLFRPAPGNVHFTLLSWSVELLMGRSTLHYSSVFSSNPSLGQRIWNAVMLMWLTEYDLSCWRPKWRVSIVP